MIAADVHRCSAGPERVLLVNHWHDDNKGDSAITMVTIALLQKQWPLVKIEVVSMLAADDIAFPRAMRHVEAAYPGVTTRGSFFVSLLSSGTRPSVGRVFRWSTSVLSAWLRNMVGAPPKELAKAVDAADLVVLVGGSDLFDVGRPWPFGTLRLLQCVMPLLVARRRGTPYALIGHTLGPIRTRTGRMIMRNVLTAAQLTVVRETHSFELVEGELGLQLGDRLQVAPDVAFALEPRDSERLRDLFAQLGDRRFAVLVPRSHIHGDAGRDDRLVEQLSRLGRKALAEGVVDHVLVFAQCLGPTVVEDDRGIAARIAACDPRFDVVDIDLAPGEVSDLYRHATFVVAVRLHAAILALTVGTPVHGIEYFTNKTRGVFASIGLDDHWSPFDAFDGAAALLRLRELLAPGAMQVVRGRAAEMRLAVQDLALAQLVR